MNSRRASIIFLSLGLSAISGCSIEFGNGETAQQFFVLESSSGESSLSVSPQGSPRGERLAIRRPRADRFIDSHRILYSASPIERSYYQLASWIDTPPDYLARMIQQKVEASGLFQTSGFGGEPTSDYLLETTVREFYHRTTERPGTVEIVVVANLLRIESNEGVAKGEFSRSIPVTAYSAEGAVKAFQIGLDEITDEVVQWLAKSLEEKQS